MGTPSFVEDSALVQSGGPADPTQSGEVGEAGGQPRPFSFSVSALKCRVPAIAGEALRRSVHIPLAARPIDPSNPPPSWRHSGDATAAFHDYGVVRLSIILGHSEVGMTMKYLHLLTEDLQCPHQSLSILNRRGRCSGCSGCSVVGASERSSTTCLGDTEMHLRKTAVQHG